MNCIKIKMLNIVKVFSWFRFCSTGLFNKHSCNSYFVYNLILMHYFMEYNCKDNNINSIFYESFLYFNMTELD